MTTSFDARAITQPGGLYASINDGLLQSLQAYLMHRDRQAQGERDMRREERGMNRQQLMDALTMAERYGVAPGQGQAGWLNPGDMPVVEAARQRFTENQAQAQQAAHDQALTRMAKRLDAVRGGVRLPDMTPEEAAEFSRAATQRAADARRVGMRDELLGAQVAGAKSEAAWNSVPGRVMRNVGEFARDLTLKAVEASGRQKPAKDAKWHVEEDMSQSRDLGDGFTVYAKPDGSRYVRGPMGEVLTPEDYAKMRGAVVGMPPAGGQTQQPGVATNASGPNSSPYTPDMGYSDDTIAALSHAGFSPSTVQEWVDLSAAADSKEFVRKLNDPGILNPAQRNALLRALNDLSKPPQRP